MKTAMYMAYVCFWAEIQESQNIGNMTLLWKVVDGQCEMLEILGFYLEIVEWGRISTD